jgi:hypothetical protein
MFSRAFLIWLVLVTTAILNAGVREKLITPRFGSHAGHVVSSLTLSVAIFLIAWISIGWIGPDDRNAALVVGTLWLALTVAFEFVAGHYVFRNSWARLLADYNILRGRVWVLVLIATFAAPIWAWYRRAV